MKCQKCGGDMVQSNIAFNEYMSEDMFYTRYFCFRCDTLYECDSMSGDFIEEYLNELGEVEYC